MTELTQVPGLRAGFRFQWEPAQQCHVLLYPEGMIKLNASAGEVLAQCDGTRTIVAILERLRAKFPEAGNSLDADVIEFLGVARERCWIELH